MIHVCVPVLRRYDLLRRLLLSLPSDASAHVIDNGRDVTRLAPAIEGFVTEVHVPDRPMGVAESWNWFIKHVSEERVIVNDDVTFGPHSLGLLLASKADLVWAANCGFACFVLRDSCVEKLGLFDETISPGYAYYEDEDYLQRLDGRGTRPPSAIAENVACGVQHDKSGTLRAANHREILEHHRRFKIAQRNYAEKWGVEHEFGLPKREKVS